MSTGNIDYFAFGQQAFNGGWHPTEPIEAILEAHLEELTSPGGIYPSLGILEASPPEITQEEVKTSLSHLQDFVAAAADTPFLQELLEGFLRVYQSVNQ